MPTLHSRVHLNAMLSIWALATALSAPAWIWRSMYVVRTAWAYTSRLNSFKILSDLVLVHLYHVQINESDLHASVAILFSSQTLYPCRPSRKESQAFVHSHLIKLTLDSGRWWNTHKWTIQRLWTCELPITSTRVEACHYHFETMVSWYDTGKSRWPLSNNQQRLVSGFSQFKNMPPTN